MTAVISAQLQSKNSHNINDIQLQYVISQKDYKI